MFKKIYDSNNRNIISNTIGYIIRKYQTFEPDFKEKFNRTDFAVCIETILYTTYDYTPVEKEEDLNFYFNSILKYIDEENDNFVDRLVDSISCTGEHSELYKKYQAIPPELRNEYVKLIVRFYLNHPPTKKLICENCSRNYF